MPSWDQLIKEISDVEFNKDIPNPLKYEAILLRKPYRESEGLFNTKDGKKLITKDKKIFHVAGELTEKVLKNNIADRLKQFKSNEIYELIAQLPVYHFITTNYDNTLLSGAGEVTIDKRYREEQIYSIRRHYLINIGGSTIRHYWPMHGNIDSPASIMLGFDHYCGSLAKIETYVKGGYDLHGSILGSMNRRIGEGIEEVISWVDLFFISDIHIIGLSLGYEETDVWWILNKRRRMKQADTNTIKNLIYYYPVESIEEDKRELLTSFDVQVNELNNPLLSQSYMRRYQEQLRNIQKNIRK